MCNLCCIRVITNLSWAQIQCHNIMWFCEILCSYRLLITSKLGSTFLSDWIPSGFGTFYIHLSFVSFFREFLKFFQFLFFVSPVSLQNSFISYENLHKLGISQPVQFLQVFCGFHSNSMFVEVIGFLWSKYIYFLFFSGSYLIKPWLCTPI